MYYQRQMNALKRANTYHLYKIKIDKLNRLYTAVNIPPEYLVEEDKTELERFEKDFLGAQLTKLDRLLQEYKIFEFVRYKYERFKTTDYYAYKVFTKFKFKDIRLGSIIWIAFYITIIIKGIQLIPWMDIFNYVKGLL